MTEGESHARDLLVAALVVGGILLALFLYTGNWPPPVVVESNSMMHVDQDEYVNNLGTTRTADVPYGRAGTIDPGDLVLVKDVDTDDIDTFADEDGDHYGRAGEVVVYFPGGQQGRTPIIHRAMTYVEALGDTDGDGDENYAVRWHSEWNQNVGCEDDTDRSCTEPGDCNEEDGHLVCRFDGGFRLPALLRRSGQHIYRPDWSGFITQGDNPENAAPDQILFDRGPVKAEWIQGVARGELPWFGLIKLSLTGNPSNTFEVQDHPYFVTIGAMTAPRDLWVMLVVGLGVVGFAPVGLDYGFHLVRRRIQGPPQPHASEPSSPAGGSKPPPDDEGSGSDDDKVQLRLE